MIDDRTGDIPYNPAARNQRRAEREKRIEQERRGHRYNREARKVACEQLGLRLETTAPVVADDFGDGSGDYITRAALPAVQLEGRMPFAEAQEQNAAYLRDAARRREKKSHKSTTDRPTDRGGES